MDPGPGTPAGQFHLQLDFILPSLQEKADQEDQMLFALPMNTFVTHICYSFLMNDVAYTLKQQNT